MISIILIFHSITYGSVPHSYFKEVRRHIHYLDNPKNYNHIQFEQNGVVCSIDLPKSLYFVNHPATINEFLQIAGLEKHISGATNPYYSLWSGFYGQEFLILNIQRTSNSDDHSKTTDTTFRLEIANHKDSFHYFVAEALSDYLILPYAHFQHLDATNINTTHRHTCRIYQMTHKTRTKRPFLFMKIRILFARSCALEILYFNTSIQWESAMKYVKIIQSTELLEIFDLEYVVDKDIKVLSYK